MMLGLNGLMGRGTYTDFSSGLSDHNIPRTLESPFHLYWAKNVTNYIKLMRLLLKWQLCAFAHGK